MNIKSKFLYNYSDFFNLFLIANFFASFIVSPFIWVYRDVFQISMNSMVALILIVTYLAIFCLLFLSNKFFYYSFNFLISEKLKKFFLKLSRYIPFTNSNFLMILGFSSFLCFVFYEKNQNHFYLFYYNLVLDSLRLLMAPALTYYAFFRFFNTDNVLSLLLKKNYFEFSKTSVVQVKMLLEAVNMGAKQFAELPMSEKVALIGLVTGPGVVVLQKGAKSKDDALAKLDTMLKGLDRSEETFLKTQAHLLTPEQYEMAGSHFERIRNQVDDVRTLVEGYNDAQFGYGWVNSLFGRQTKTMEHVATGSYLVQRKVNGALPSALRVVYPEGSLGNLKKIAGAGGSLTSPKMFEKIPSILESSCDFCKKIICFFGC